MVGRRRRSIEASQATETGRHRAGVEERLEVAKLRRLVGEGELFGERFQKKVEGIVDGHLGDQIDLDPEQIGLVGEREPRDVVALRILLPVQEMRRWRDALRIGEDRRPTVWRRPQADELRQQLDGPVVPVLRHVTEGNVNAHACCPPYISPAIMKIFHCDHCGHLLFFESTSCVSCGHRVAYLPDLQVVTSLEPDGADILRSVRPEAREGGYRLCANLAIEGTCNWAVPVDDDRPLCASCRITRVIPNLGNPGSAAAWSRLEGAKRRLLFTLMELGLPLPSRTDDPEHGLAFEFLADPEPGGPPLLTGHADGVITINIAEADDSERERRRAAMGEPYRTLLGHMRHESGHYYWDRCIRGTASELDAFRSIFGDERADYNAALASYYQNGAQAGWQDQFVSAYATAHPWEDWAETWAHYLHMVDTLETAAACGLSLKPRRADEPTLAATPYPVAPQARHVRPAGRQLVSADLHAEQPESRPRALRCVPLRALSGSHRQAAVCRRRRGPDETRRSRPGWHAAADARSLSELSRSMARRRYRKECTVSKDGPGRAI